MTAKSWCRVALALASSLAVTLSAQAQVWPAKPVNIVLPYAPGGGTDVVARLLASRLSERLGQAFVVENRPGATGNIAAAWVARSAPDGHTLLLGSAANFAINSVLFKSMPYRQSDLIPVLIAVDYPNVLVARHDAPFDTVQELVAQARRHPGQLNYATAGIGATGHLSMEMFSLATGIRLTNVVYKGSGPSLIALLGGEVDLSFDTLAVYGPQIRAGKLKPLAVSTEVRAVGYPEIPTLQEAGVKGFSAAAWFAVGAPTATPLATLERINQAFRAVLAEPGVVATLAANGFTARSTNLDAAQDFVRAETVKWTRVIRDAHITPE